MIAWNDAQIFLAAAETGSFSAAAQRLALGQPTVSRRIAQLEEQLGLVLFHRGRRGTTLTADGERLLPHVQQMERWAAELDATVAAREVSPEGVVTVAAPPGVGSDAVVPFAAWLRHRHPAIRLSLLCSIDYLDLTRGQADFAFRSRPSDDPALVTLAEFRTPVFPMASEAYAATLPMDATVADVDWIGWSPKWEHLSPNRELAQLVDGFRPVFASDDYLLQIEACRAGIGAYFLAGYAHPRFADHGLVRLDLPTPSVSGSMYLVCARSMRYVPRVDAVLTAFEEWIGEGHDDGLSVHRPLRPGAAHSE